MTGVRGREGLKQTPKGEPIKPPGASDVLNCPDEERREDWRLPGRHKGGGAGGRHSWPRDRVRRSEGFAGSASILMLREGAEQAPAEALSPRPASRSS